MATREQAQSTQGAVQMRAVPAQLATVTDLSQAQVSAITEALNPLIADHISLYIKTKNYHWHLSGPRFRDLHLLFEEQADAILAAVDSIAERVRRIGGTTVRSISHISQLRTLSDDNDDFVSPQEMVRRLMEDHNQIVQNMRAAVELCEQNKDLGTTNELQELLDKAERRKWFLFEVSQEGESKP
jgi:starvation-inducible DNA-binding protein